MQRVSLKKINNQMKHLIYKKRALKLLNKLKEKDLEKYLMLKRIVTIAFEKRKNKNIRKNRKIIVK